ncbi:MAG TPA: tRNA (adenosine(37)-N6)-threonylcarbamoyltransferase complex transferase subunit TsaD [Chloroflexi bacterium]|jgi:N6-L-threonylcarbamoyladenine synthase|nr:tRNA (adenosine(37)-N6)-threonylcarbamoyltransferase complex transferase subunit TsaD [Chloroflexota bacterium]HAL26568.1 tRNA (adenosine(37)-N6)-threonylcarbamoyltransferase complex transferase subunit TsaD [Chloroflexota bacterium]
MRILAFETSCDETGVAVVEDGRRVRANVIGTQLAHQATGGIVPEVAAREHLRAIDPITANALRDAGITLREVDAVAATVGPGLIGCLLVGANYARGLALAAGLPFVGVNHLEGHVYANWLYDTEDVPAEPELPAVVLVVSGAHSDLVLMEAHRRFRLLGRTIDDAAGEAFDKVARLLGLGFPGGPEIETAAKDGNPEAFPLPKAWLADRYDFSFSGLKTAVLRLVRSLEEKGPVPVGDVAASFQKAIVDALAEKTARAAAEHGVRCVMLGGGVAANSALRAEIERRIGVPLRVPPPRLCTDNGAMIGAAAFFSLRHRGAEMPAGVRSNLPLA